MLDFNIAFSSMLYSFLFVINETPIPAQIIKIAVEFPVKIFRKRPAELIGDIMELKLKLKLTIYIPNIAYALAKSKPIIRSRINFLFSV